MPQPACKFGASVVGDPVDTGTGAVLERKLEFRLIGPLELSWWRHYDSSQVATRFALGWGHTHEFDRILLLGEEHAVLGLPVGQLVRFPLPMRNGVEVAAMGYRLRRRSAVHYEVHRHAEPSMDFVFEGDASRARLRRLSGRSGEILFDYTPDNRLEQIRHSTGAVIQVAKTQDRLIAELVLQRADAPAELLLAYQYDARGNLVGTRNAAGHGYALTYDAANRLTVRRGRKGFTFRYHYDAKGRCIFSAGDRNWYGVALRYDEAGRITTVTRPDGGQWLYRFSPAGRLEEVVDPLGGAAKLLYDGEGRLTHEVDPNGNVTQLLYDPAGAPIRKIDPLGHQATLPEDINAPDPLAQRVAANAAEYHHGRLIDVDAIRPPNAAELATLALAPRAHLLAAMRADPDPAAAAEIPFEVPPLGVAWWPAPRHGRVFTDLGKLVGQPDDAGRMRRWTYDASGNLASHTDFDGATWHYDYGAWHLLLGQTNPLGAETRFDYTTNEQIASCIDAGGSLSEYRYDQRDQLIEVRRHGVVRETYRRDAAGNLVAKYGTYGRELLRREVGPGNLLLKRSLASGDEHRFAYTPTGRPRLIASSADRVECDYDGLGNSIAELRNGRGITHRFEGWRQPAETIYFDRFMVRIERPTAGALTLIDPLGGRHVIEHRGHGIVVQRFANGSIETAQFDNLGRCLFKHLEREAGVGWSRRYDWSGEGELRRIQDSRHGEILHQYDPAHRLRGRIVTGRAETYTLDLADNLLAQPGLAGVTMRDGNRLAEANGERFDYDDRNHIVCRHGPAGITEYGYDSRDLLVQATTPAGEWAAAYDGIGRRTRKTWQGRTTEFYWYGDQLIGEVGPGGSLRLYVYNDPLALTPLLCIDYPSLDAPPESGRVLVVLADQLGTPVLLEDASGRDVWSAAVAPYGHADITADEGVELALRFPDHYADPEIGLHYNRFRHYDPILGRYLQSDPWGIAGGPNLYAYPANPLLRADVRGLGEEGSARPRRPEDDAEGTTAGARLASEAGMPPAPPGYHYADVGGAPRLKANPGSDNPPLMYNPRTGDFQQRPAADAYPRVGFDDAERREVFNNSPRNEDGDVVCPCGKRVASPDPADMQMGHKPGHDYATARDEAILNQTPRSDFREQQKILSHYRAEHPACNMSHRYE